MALLTLPATLAPGSDAEDIQANFVATRAVVNGGLDGTNLSPATAETVGTSATNAARRGITTSLSDTLLTSSYTVVSRAPTVTVPANGILHVSLIGFLQAAFGGTASFAIQCNGVTVRSRFGVASGASSGLMEVLTVAVSPLSLIHI